jgi:hypothetical protein
MNAQMPWLKLECPKDGSLKSLCLSFFFTLDRLLETNYYALYGKEGKATVGQMQIYMAFLSDLLKIGVLVIDEIQNLNRAKSGGAGDMLNFFVGLANVIRVPVILIGTYEAFDIFTKEFRQMRRGMRQGSVVWERMKRDSASWQILLRGIWRYQYVRRPVELGAELSDALYYISQGVTELAVVGFMLAQERAIAAGVETLDKDIVYSAAADNMQIAFKPLEDIRLNNQERLQDYSDVLMPEELKSSYQRQPQKEQQDEAPEPPEAQKKRAPKKPSPDIVPSAGDLRHSLQADDVYSALKESGAIGMMKG